MASPIAPKSRALPARIRPRNFSASGVPPGSRVTTTSAHMVAQLRGETTDLGRLAGAFAAFESDEPTVAQGRLLPEIMSDGPDGRESKMS